MGMVEPKSSKEEVMGMVEPESSKPGEMAMKDLVSTTCVNQLPSPEPAKRLPWELLHTKVEIRDNIEGRMAIQGIIREMNDSYLVVKGANGEAHYVFWRRGLIIHPKEF